MIFRDIARIFRIMCHMPAIITIVLIVLMTGGIGSLITSSGMKWYKGLNLPPWNPSGQMIGSVWTTIYILSGLSAYFFWHASLPDNWRTAIFLCFILNAVLNVLWCAVFFRWHAIGWAFAEALVLEASVLALILLLLPYSYVAAMLLIPYALWVLFASFLTFTVWQVNR